MTVEEKLKTAEEKLKRAEEQLGKTEEALNKSKKQGQAIKFCTLMGLLIIFLVLIWGITTNCTTTDFWTWHCPW